MNILEELKGEVSSIKDELNGFKEEARAIDRKIRYAQFAIICAQRDLGELLDKIARNGINPKRCRHELPEMGRPGGLGYSGHVCKKCLTLLVKDTIYPGDPSEEGKVLFQFRPEHPFKPDCKHPRGKVLTYQTAIARIGRAVVNRHDIVPLCTDGHYCTVCGACWE